MKPERKADLLEVLYGKGVDPSTLDQEVHEAAYDRLEKEIESNRSRRAGADQLFIAVKTLILTLFGGSLLVDKDKLPFLLNSSAFASWVSWIGMSISVVWFLEVCHYMACNRDLHDTKNILEEYMPVRTNTAVWWLRSHNMNLLRRIGAWMPYAKPAIFFVVFATLELIFG